MQHEKFGFSKRRKTTRIGTKNRSVVQLISKFIAHFARLSSFLIFSFFDVRIINGINIPNSVKMKELKADRSAKNS